MSKTMTAMPTSADVNWGVWCPYSLSASHLSRVKEYGYHCFHDFQFDRPGSMRDDCLLYITVSGQPNIWHAQQPIAASRGQVTLYLTGEDHRYRADVWEAFWFHYYPSPFLTALLQKSGVTAGLTFPAPLGEESLLALQEIFSYPSLPEELAAHRCAVLLEHTIYSCLHQQDADLHIPHRKRLQEVASHITRHPALPHDIETLAAMANLSAPHFTALFKREFGISVHAFVIAQRIQHAQYLLMRTELSAGEVGLLLGYKTPHQFYAAFKKVTGMPPRTYRQRHAGEPSVLPLDAPS